MIADKSRACTLGFNHNKEVLMICLNKECQASRLCCVTCIDEFHNKHELISLHKFQYMLLELDEKYKPDVKNDVVNIIRQYEVEVNKELDEALARAIHQYNNTKKLIDSVFQEVVDMVKYEKSEKSVVQQFYSEFDSKTVNLFLKKINQSKNSSYENPQSTLATIKKAQAIVKTQIKDFQIGFNALMAIMAKNISNIKNALTQSKFVPFTKRFSKIHKAECLEVNQAQSTTKRVEGTGGYPINLLESPMTKENNEISIKITEEPGNKGIWMGVAILDIVKNNGFKSCYGIGKGTYAIDQVGASHVSAFSWNHHDTNFNSQPKVAWQFHLGDVINIKVDFAKSTVTFTRGMDQYSQPIRLDLGDIYAFAGPTNLNDCLMIV